jgi:hypothetical protein
VVEKECAENTSGSLITGLAPDPAEVEKERAEEDSGSLTTGVDLAAMLAPELQGEEIRLL